MAKRTLITQSEFAALHDALNSMAENLNAHVNQALGKGHSVEVVPGFTDGAGNDLTTYQSSLGDIVGDHQVRFNVGGLILYAPAKTTVFAGQHASTGIVPTGGSNYALLQDPGQSALVTDSTSIDVQQAQNVNNLLLEHAKVSHESAHVPFAAFAKNTFDSSGGLIGHYVIRLQFAGTVYEIPCDPRLGGPGQPPRAPWIVTAYSDHSIYLYIDGQTGGNPGPYSATCQVAGGTLPIDFVWYLLTANVPVTQAGNDPVNAPGNWTALTNSDGTTTGLQLSQDGHLRASATAVNTTSQSVLTVNFALSDVGTSNHGYIRCKASNAGGAASSTNYINISLYHAG